MAKKNPFMKEPPFAIQAADQDMVNEKLGKGGKGGRKGFMKAFENVSKKRPKKKGKQ
jgi:hypothetical protein